MLGAPVPCRGLGSRLCGDTGQLPSSLLVTIRFFVLRYTQPAKPTLLMSRYTYCIVTLSPTWPAFSLSHNTIPSLAIHLTLAHLLLLSQYNFYFFLYCNTPNSLLCHNTISHCTVTQLPNSFSTPFFFRFSLFIYFFFQLLENTKQKKIYTYFFFSFSRILK